MTTLQENRLLVKIQEMIRESEQRIVKTIMATLDDITTEEATVSTELTQEETDEQKYNADVESKITALQAQIAAGTAPPDATAQLTALQAIAAKVQTDDAAIVTADAALNPAPATTPPAATPTTP